MNYLACGLCERGHEVTIACRSHAVKPHPDIKFLVLSKFAIGSAWRYWAFARALEQFLADNREQYDVVFALGRTWSQDIVRVSGGCHQTWLDTMAGPRRSAKPKFKDRVQLRLVLTGK